MKKILYTLFHPRHILVLGVDFAFIGIFALLAINIKALDPVSRMMENFSVSDLYYDIEHEGTADTCQSIIIVDMAELYDRGSIGELLMEINDCQPAVIGVDISFEGLKDDPTGSALLAEAAQSAENAVFGFKMEDYNPDTNRFERIVHSFFTPNGEVTEGFANLNTKGDGSTVRDFTLIMEQAGQKYPSFATSIVRSYLGEDAPPYKANEKRNIDFSPTEFISLRHDEIAANKDMLKGKIVLLGGLSNRNDMHFTPVGKIAGITLWGYCIRTLIEGQEPMPLTGAAKWIFIVLLSYFFISVQCIYDRWAQNVKTESTKIFLTTPLTFTFKVGIVAALTTFFGFLIFTKWGVALPIEIPLVVEALSCRALGVYKGFRQLWIEHHQIHNHLS